MAEGPQVALRTAWLQRRLAGRRPVAVESPRAELATLVQALAGRRVVGAACKGEHLFVELEGGVHLHNHLRMDGRWRAQEGTDAELPPDTRLALRLETETIVNLHGEVLEVLSADEVRAIHDRLGVDVMEEPCPRTAIADALRGSGCAVADALLDQALVCGLGSVARSEALFLAGVDPRTSGGELTGAEAARIAAAACHVTRQSLAEEGRWQRRVYQRADEPCPRCGATVIEAPAGSSGQTVFACSRCQSLPASAAREPGRFALGCAVWSFPGWVGDLYPSGAAQRDFLHLYAERLTAVEGNTTFYAVPTAEVVARWAAETPPGFQFVPKLPRAVTHEGDLRPRIDLAWSFVDRMRGLGSRLGPIFAQLPGTYGPERLTDLALFAEAWPRDAARLCVEVRHPDWFVDPGRPRLVAALAERDIGLVTLDTRPIYADSGDPQADSQRRKPDLPVLPLAVGPAMVRFIAHPELARNTTHLAAWADRVARWLADGRDVYFFAHCPLEERSPAVARAFQGLLEERCAVEPLPWCALDHEQQLELF